MVRDWVNYSILNLNAKVFSTLGNHTIGIQFVDNNNKVEAIHGLFEETINPIPLTEEILVKNGFEKNHNDEAPAEECYFYRLFAKPCGWFDIDAFGLEEELGAEFTYHDININYVHELQHLLRLAGIEKAIEL